MKLSIIIVSWNVRDKLKKNLESIFKSEGDFAFEVFVVDNNSSDNTVSMITSLFPKVKLIVNSQNLGFSRASNIAIKQTKGEYILLLNPDMLVFKDTFQNIILWMDSHPEAGICAPKLIGQDGKIIKHVRKFPTFFDQFMIILKIPHIFPKVLHKYLCEDFNYDLEGEVDSVRGSFFMIRREIINKIGLLDERFFVWFEEVDYCRRAREKGIKIFYTPQAQSIDLVGQSFSQLEKKITQKYFQDSMIKYFQKWHNPLEVFFLKIFWHFSKLILLSANIFKIKTKIKT